MGRNSNFSLRSRGGVAYLATVALFLVSFPALVFPDSADAAGKTQAIAAVNTKPSNKPTVSAAKAATAAEADRLYNEAVEFYQVERYARAYDLGQEACRQAPQNAHFRAGLAVFAGKDRPLLYSLSTAREAARLAPGDANVLTNLGTQFQKNGQRAEAVEQYKKAETSNAKDYRPKLGIAQCLCVDGNDGLQIAERELKAACDTPEDSTAKWVNIGSTYFVLQLYPSASACFNRALKLDAKNYVLQVWRLKSALAEHDLATNKSLADDVVTDRLIDQQVALGLALLPDNDFSPDLKARLLQICEKNFIGQGDFYYQLGRNLEAGAHLDMAFQAYRLALKAAPGECKYIISEIGNRLSAGRSDEAVAIWGQSSAERNKAAAAGIPAVLPRDNSVFAHVFTCVGELLQSDSPGVRIVRAKFKNIKCGCRLPVIQFKLISQPGVVFAHLEDAKEYPCVFVYDAKKTSSESVFKHVRKEEDIIEVISDGPVQSIPELVRLIQSVSDKPDKHIFSLWSFLPPPMELPK